MTGGGIEVCSLFLCNVGKCTYIAYELLEYLPVMAQCRRSFTEIKNAHTRSFYLRAVRMSAQAPSYLRLNGQQATEIRSVYTY